ncbi:SIR2 family NAD-dependent protein deacylase [Paenibacillus agri]|uniref:SIR2 family protein n=1 Tax=Paenibacillus agri TaxID=2744309 RepID=A0A850ELH0_9BACL|nr:SIR2 family protein [Paenibacillus agri]NUU61256.1 SIR2 family protein [Paenibacillus agri]
MDKKVEELFEEKLEMYPHLKNIRNKLWASDGKSRVSVMIGAGFSLNAQKIEDSFEGMAVWGDIKNKLIQELNHHKGITSKDVLEIGQLYVKEYGRSSLDTILKEAIPDNNYEPDEIHYSLLKLPWTDIYTTNYDTLLERAKKFVYERNYQTIYNISDITSSVQPRIIKLHGSFPANRPFVFTEKDYNEYQVKFSPLVNMVQQSIMETTFVLIGFSGDDPNFKRWTSWVSNNLGEHMSKIYMIGFGQEHRKSELEDIGVTLIDFKNIYSEYDQPYKAMFTDIFEFLAYKNREEKTMWPHKVYSEDNDVQSFIYNRNTYPGWIVMPDEIRRKYAKSIRLSAIKLVDYIKEKTIDDKSIDFLNEILWCYDKFYIPLEYYVYQIIVTIIDNQDQNKFDERLYPSLFCLLKEARLDCDEEAFVKYQGILENLPLNKEQCHHLIYEKIMYFFIRNDIETLEKLLLEWDVQTNEIEWGIKKAVIYARINEKDTAKLMLENYLQTIRGLLAIKNDDYRLLSLESVALHNRNRITSELDYGYDRLKFLNGKSCNVNKEFDQTILSIKKYENSIGTIEKIGFDPGTRSTLSSMGDYMKQELLDSFAVLQLQEIYALSINDKLQYELALKNVEFYYPIYSQLKRINIITRKKVDEIFSRETVYKSDIINMTKLVNILKNAINYENKSNIDINVALEILSRIYFAVSIEIQKEIDGIIFRYIQNKENYSIEDIEVLNKLITRISCAKNKKEFEIFCEQLINIEIKVQDKSDYFLYNSSFFEPFLILLGEKRNETKIKILEEQLDLLFKHLSYENTYKSMRESALIRLTFLALTNNFSEKHYNQFIRYIQMLPRDKKFGISDFIFSTTFDKIIQSERVLSREEKIEFLKRDIPVFYFKSSINETSDLDNYFREIRNVFLDYIGCNEENVPDLTIYKTWLEKFYLWWDSQKEGLLREQDRNSFMPISDYFIIVITTLKNNIWGTIPEEYLSEDDRTKIAQIFNESDEKRPDVSIYLIPCLNRLNINIKYSLKDVINWLWDSNKTNVKAAATILYDYLVFIYKSEIYGDSTVIKNELFNMMKYGSAKLQKITFDSISHSLKNKIDIFNISDCEFLVQYASNYLQGIKETNIEIATRDDFELISSFSNLVSHMCKNKSDFVGNRLDEWKEYIRNHKLPEVRTHADVFA